MDKIKSDAPPVVTVNDPAPFDVKVAAAAESPKVTVSDNNLTSPVPFGVNVISALFAEVEISNAFAEIISIPPADAVIITAALSVPLVFVIAIVSDVPPLSVTLSCFRAAEGFEKRSRLP